MKEYIDRAAAINAIRQYQYPYGVEFLLANIPAADVVEVVKCRNCKRAYANANDPGVIYCGWSKEPTPPDGFCHRGEREQNGQGGRP